MLGAIRYAPNSAYLHRDERLMPKRRSAWASWNFLRWPRQDRALNDVAVTYWMNRLQGIDDSMPLFLSLNPPFEPAPAKTFGRYIYDHPQYDASAFRAQQRLKASGAGATVAARGPATAFTKTAALGLTIAEALSV